jgi:hypothetical protein
MVRGFEGPTVRRFGVATSLILACAVALGLAQAPALPARLDDAAFWKIVTEFSELGGGFHSDNFTSNEPGFAEAAATLASGRHGGAYLGVGPEQNFSYIAAIRPDIAFMVDIRRQAVMQHLLFKALFELSANRADFIARLFSRPRPSGLENAPIDEIWKIIRAASDPDRAIYRKSLAEIETHLTKTHGFALTADEIASLEYVYDAFFSLGPDINYGGYKDKLTTGNTNFEKLSTTADGAGVRRSFLATEESFQLVKSMQTKNLIVPVQADIGGPKALRAIADYLRERRTIVRAFYISNVEQYLFGQTIDKATDVNGGFSGFARNLAALPVDAESLLLRTPSPPNTRGIRPPPPCRIAAFLAAIDAGRVTSQSQARQCAG